MNSTVELEKNLSMDWYLFCEYRDLYVKPFMGIRQQSTPETITCAVLLKLVMDIDIDVMATMFGVQNFTISKWFDKSMELLYRMHPFNVRNRQLHLEDHWKDICLGHYQMSLIN